MSQLALYVDALPARYLSLLSVVERLSAVRSTGQGGRALKCFAEQTDEPFTLGVDDAGEATLIVQVGRLSLTEYAALSRCMERIPAPRVSCENDVAV